METVLMLPNVECKIISIDGNRQLANRLTQMGVLPGSVLRIVRVGPLGRTVEVLIDQGESIALRSEELRKIKCKILALPLAAVKNKQKAYRVRNFVGGWGFIQKMQARGIFPSDIIRIKETDGYEIISKDSRLIRVGRGEAEKIIVEPVDETL